MNDKTTQETSIGLVLSGGGFRGMAHIGVIKLLEELDIVPAFISGTSIGAIVGAFYAAGHASDTMLEFFKETNLFGWKNYAFRKPGIIDPLKFLPALEQYFPYDNFETLEKKLFISVTNLESGDCEVKHSGKLIRYMLASAAMPFLFAPLEVDGSLFADGGMINNFPIEPIQDVCQHIIGVYVNPLEEKHKSDLKHAHSVLERAFHIAIANQSKSKFSNCSVMIVPQGLSAFSLMDAKHTNEIMEIGYKAASELKSELTMLSSL